MTCGSAAEPSFHSAESTVKTESVHMWSGVSRKKRGAGNAQRRILTRREEVLILAWDVGAFDEVDMHAFAHRMDPDDPARTALHGRIPDEPARKRARS